MAQVIIFKNDAGGVALLSPNPEYVAKLGIHAIAAKDVPYNRPYAILDESQLPQDHTFFDAWEIAEGLLKDGVGGQSDRFSKAQLEVLFPPEEGA